MHEALRERKLGQLEGTQQDELAVIKRLRENKESGSFESMGIETDEQLQLRLTGFLKKIATAHYGQTVLIVTHGSSLRELLFNWNFAPRDRLLTAIITNTALVKLQSNGVNFVILETEGIELK